MIIQEAFHRCLLSDANNMRKRALCSLMVTMRNFEADMIPKEYAALGIFYSFTEAAVMGMALKINSDEDTSIQICPSHVAAMLSEMRVEVLSLMRVRVLPHMISMTQTEVKALWEHNNVTVYEGEKVPGSAEVSAFNDVFAD